MASRHLSLFGSLAQWSFVLVTGCAQTVVSNDPAPPRERPRDVSARHTAEVTTTAPRAEAPSAAEGVWYLNADGARLTLEVVRRRDGDLAGTLSAESGGRPARVEGIAWDRDAARVRFHVALGDTGGRAWFDARVTDGVLLGRTARTSDERAPGALQYEGHVTGWNASVIDRAPVPRVYDLRWSDGRLGRVRIDRKATGEGLVGTLKVYASADRGTIDEQEERDLTNVTWDGANLTFEVREDDGSLWRYVGEARARLITGEARSDRAWVSPVTWSGARAEVLTHGLSVRPRAERDAWSARTRRQLARLTMAGASSPAAVRVETLAHGLAPIESQREAMRAAPPQSYTLTELRAEHDVVDAYTGATVTRRSHLYIARPTTAAPARGFPVVVAANGHFGSAQAMMNPDSGYGYGDAYAREGYVVVAVDVSHRPLADRARLYTDFTVGDDPVGGNVPHPAVRAAGLDSDWEEDGERAWDVMRAVDLALALPDIDASRVIVTGLSMGGEVATMAGALDPRAGSVVVAGFAPDLGVIAHRANHPCWQWTHADIREYVGVSVLQALVAPRLLVVETGTADRTFSDFRAPFASDKQVLRRSRVAWGDESYRLVHYLHDGAHVYRTGEPALDLTATRGISTPVRVAPDAAGSLTWQTDAATRLAPVTVFDLTRASFGG